MCGKVGHSIAQCRHGSEVDKCEFYQKVKETKATKAKQGNNSSIKFDKKRKKHDGRNNDPTMQH